MVVVGVHVPKGSQKIRDILKCLRFLNLDLGHIPRTNEDFNWISRGEDQKHLWEGWGGGLLLNRFMLIWGKSELDRRQSQI